MLRFVTKASRYLQRVEEVILSGSILIIAALTILNVICRTAFGNSLAFAEEVSQFCVIFVCFVGLSYASSKGRHIRMTAIYDQLSKPVRKGLMLIITVGTSVLAFALSWYAAAYVMTVYELGGIYPATRVPQYMIYSVAPVGLFLAGVHYGLAAIRNLSDDAIFVSFERKDEYEEGVVTQEI